MHSSEANRRMVQRSLPIENTARRIQRGDNRSVRLRLAVFRFAPKRGQNGRLPRPITGCVRELAELCLAQVTILRLATIHDQIDATSRSYQLRATTAMSNFRLGRYTNRYGELDDSHRRRGQPGLVESTSPLQDLAKAAFGKARVRCWTTPRDRKWGRHDEHDAGVLYLKMRATGPADCRLCSFDLDLTFCNDPQKGDVTFRPQADTEESVTTVRHDVCLIDLPAPSFVRGQVESDRDAGEVEAHAYQKATRGDRHRSKKQKLAPTTRYWKFRSEPTEGDCDGRVFTARWMWETEVGHQYHSDKLLHGGVAVRHSGNPFNVSCQVKGKVTKPGGFRLKFSNWHHKPERWQVVPTSCQEDIRYLVDKLEADMIQMNTTGVIRKHASSVCCAEFC